MDPESPYIGFFKGPRKALRFIAETSCWDQFSSCEEDLNWLRQSVGGNKTNQKYSTSVCVGNCGRAPPMARAGGRAHHFIQQDA